MNSLMSTSIFKMIRTSSRVDRDLRARFDAARRSATTNGCLDHGEIVSISRKSGFTLVEVALAVMAVGLGLMTIIGLFPAGLQNASDDAADTRAGLFAEAVFSGIRGAATNNDVAVWDGTFIGTSLAVEGMNLSFDGAAHAVRFPISAADAPDNYLRYILSISQVTAGPGKIYSATLSICDGQYGPFIEQNKFYTEFYYTGM